MADPLAALPPKVREVTERFQDARERVLLAMIAPPLMEPQSSQRQALVADLRFVADFITAIDHRWKEQNNG